MNFEELREEVRVRSDIVEIIGQEVQLRPSGTTMVGRCPFHKEKTPSFNVDPRRQIFHCFGCKKGGDVFSFVMEFQNVDFMTALRFLGQRASVDVEEVLEPRKKGEVSKSELFEIHQKLGHEYFKQLMESPAAEAAREYLKDRKLFDLAQEWLIGYAPDQWDMVSTWGQQNGYSPKLLKAAGVIKTSEKNPNSVYDVFRDRIMFPLRDEQARILGFSGRVLNKESSPAKYVNSPQTMLFTKSRVLFGFDRARKPIADKRQAIICEGQIDVIRCQAAGMDNVVAALGTALTEDHARAIKRYADEVILVLDSDTAGQNAALRSAEIFLGAGLGLKIVSLPEGEDPDSLILQQGNDALAPFLQNAQPLVDYQIDVLSKRENINDETGMMRVSREVLTTISKADTAVQQNQLIKRAAEKLGLAEGALASDLAKIPKARVYGNTPRKATAVRQVEAVEKEAQPPEEKTLLEILLAYPHEIILVERYLPMECITDADCRAAIQSVLVHGAEGIMQHLPTQQPISTQLIAEAMMNARAITEETGSPETAVKSLILLIRRKTLERTIKALPYPEADDPNSDDLLMDRAQIRMSISKLKEAQRNQTWEDVLPILQAF